MPRGASLTANAVAFFRVMENYRPDGLFQDSQTEHYLADWQVQLAQRSLTHSFFDVTSTFLPTSLAHFVSARHRFIDDHITSAYQSGIRQFVNLGAGFDGRGERLFATLNDVNYFELDFLATQEKKRSFLKQTPDYQMVPIDFQTQRVSEVLTNVATFDQTLPTFFIWEGVSMYLPSDAIWSFFKDISQFAASKSQLAADFLTNVGQNPISRLINRTGLSFIGEPLRFWLSYPQLSAKLQQYNWRIYDYASAKALESRYHFAIPTMRSPLPRTIYPQGYLVCVELIHE